MTNSATFITPPDVLVIGGGLAGHCAALAATECGATVVLLEKQPNVGGSTVLSGGFFAFAGTPFQQERGIRDDRALLYDDLIAMGGGEADPTLVRAYSEGQRDLYEWLVRHGIVFTALELSSGQSVPRSHVTDSVRLIATLAEHGKRSGRVKTEMGTRAIRLLRDSVGGPVAGVRIEDAGGTRELRAGSIVLASGGFSRSEELLRLFAPAQAGALRIGGGGNTGDGLRMAWQFGAGLRDMGQVKGTFGTHPNTGADKHELLLAYYAGAIMVNRAGHRFVDESVSYKILGEACLAQPGRIAFQIFDQAIMDGSQPGVPLFDFGAPLRRGLLIKADSLPDLAQRCGIDPDALVQTVADYNRGVDLGRDPAFGRDGLCNHYGALARIGQAPFYAYPSTTVVLATYCGLAIDAQAQVRDVFGEPIRGLFAAGEITGGFHGHAYMTGSSLGKAAYFGRVAGQSAAALVR